MKVIVIGAGASGMMAAYAAGEAGHKVLLLEKNEKPGKKLYITGKGRCNFTNDCAPEEFLANVVSNPKFLYSALQSFTPRDMQEFLTRFGCEVKVERGRRAFPASDKASDVTVAMVRALKQAGVELRFGVEVRGLCMEPGDEPGRSVNITQDSNLGPSVNITQNAYIVNQENDNISGIDSRRVNITLKSIQDPSINITIDSGSDQLIDITQNSDKKQSGRMIPAESMVNIIRDTDVEWLENRNISGMDARSVNITQDSDSDQLVDITLDSNQKQSGRMIPAESMVNIIQNTNQDKSVRTVPAVTGVRLADGSVLMADHVIVATGGLSYPATGSTGDGLEFAKAAGLKLTDCAPSLVPFAVRESWVKELQGLSLKNVTLTVGAGKKRFFEQGELLFTHFGISGPLVLSASARITSFGKDGIPALIDLKPALSEEKLDLRLQRDFEENRNKSFHNALDGLLPKSMIPVLVRLSGIDPEKKVNSITKKEREQLRNLLKALPLTVTGTRGYPEAVVTRGGVSVKEIDPKTMQAKKVKGLSFCGEVLDLDALTGGYNLQIAWSTGYAAGRGIQESSPTRCLN